MTSVAEIQKRVGRVVSGQYRVLATKRVLCDERNQSLTYFMIADASGFAICIGSIEAGELPAEELAKNVVVDLQDVVTVSGGRRYLRVQNCVPAVAVERPSWHLIPRCWVPKTALHAFDRLLALVDRLASAPLRAFMGRLFAETSIAAPYVRLPASRRHHHAYLGGLLQHSVECAEAAEQLAPRFLPECEAALGIVGALLHDIGKIRSMTGVGTDQYAIRGATQEALNLEVLAPFFSALDASWPAGGAALREILAPAQRSGPAGGWPPLLLTDFIRYIDRLSAGADLRNTRFRKLPVRQRCTRTEHGQLLARVLPPVPAHKTVDIEAIR